MPKKKTRADNSLQLPKGKASFGVRQDHRRLPRIKDRSLCEAALLVRASSIHSLLHALTGKANLAGMWREKVDQHNTGNPIFERIERDLPADFRIIDKLRDWLPILEGAMRKGRFSEEQMVAIIREADRDPVAAVAKRHGISEQTIYTWRKRFGGLQASDVKRLRQLEVENGRLKKLVAERDLEIEVMKEVAAKKW